MTPAEFGAYFRGVQESLHAFAEKLLGDYHAAWDVVQRTFIRLFRCCHTLRGPDPKAFVWQALKWEIRDALRKRAKRLVPLTDQVQDELTDDSAPPEPVLSVDDRPEGSIEEPCREILRETVRGMTGEQHEAFKVWLQTRGDGPRALAILGITEATYAGRVHQAKKKLRHAWHQHQELFAQLSDGRFWELLYEIVCGVRPSEQEECDE